MKRADYNEISSVYDQRYQPGSQVGILTALKTAAQSINAAAILEVGCDTGHWLAQMADFPARYGLDFSRGMLTRAALKVSPSTLVQGTASQLPFKKGVFDFVFCVNALHHFDDPLAFIRQAHRLLRPGSLLAVITMDPHTSLDHWYLYDYFPGVLDKDLLRYPSSAAVAGWMEQAGFGSIHRSAAETLERNYADQQVFEDPALQKNGTSQLAMLTMPEFEQGIDNIRRAIKSAEEIGSTIHFLTRIQLHIWLGSAL